MMEDPQHAHRARARELALGTIVEQTARMRVERTLKAKSRVSGQTRDFKNGDLVDVYRAPPNKDMDGWRGPAKIVDASPETLADGIVHVRWGGRVLICRLQDVREHIAFWSMFFLAFPSEWSVILAFIKTIGRSILHVGWLLSEQGWIVSKGARDHPEIYAQGTLIAVSYTHLTLPTILLV